MGVVQTRVVTGRDGVVGEVRAAGALMAALRAPVPARAPWLTAVLDARSGGRPIAVVVEREGASRTDGLALLSVRRRGVALAVTLLGDGVGVVPPGRPPARLLARDDEVAAHLAAGVLAVVRDRRTPWSLSLSGLPLGDPTSRALGALCPDAAFGTSRSSRLVDRLDSLGRPVVRSRAPRDVERRLPALLAAQPDPRVRAALRVTARLHAAIDQVEVAEVVEGSSLRAALLTLVDGADRQPWVGCGEPAALSREMGSPTTSLRLAGGWLSRPVAPR